MKTIFFHILLTVMATALVTIAASSSLRAGDINPLRHPSEVQSIDSLELRVYFPQGKSVLIPSFRNNDIQLTQFTIQMRRYLADTTMRLKDIVIYTGASPEGKVSFNRQLSIDRGVAVRSYLESALNLSDSVFVMVPMGEDWERLAEMAERYRVPSWERILEIIDECPEDENDPDGKALEERKRLIRSIDDGRVWSYLLENIFPELRGGDNYIACHFTPKDPEIRTVVVESHTTTSDTVYVYSKDTVWMAPTVMSYMPYVSDGAQPAYSVTPGRRVHRCDTSARRNYQFAIKTNLLMDLGTALNVELEFPVGKHWSIMAEHWFPWWTFWYGGYSYTLQVLQTSIEGRYWFSDRTGKPVLTGLFLGAYTGIAVFDVEWRSDGIQGETFLNSGLSFGYSFNIGRNWRFETSISAGYFRFDGRTYHHSDYWMLRIWQENRTVNWIGPTKLKCSISWLIPPHGKKSRKEGSE